MAALTVGKKAPLFTLPSDGGQDISLSDYKGGKVILYFYPKDNTSGCTLEAQAFRANLEEFKKRCMEIGVQFQKWIFLQLHTYLHTPLRKSMNPIPVRLLLFRIDNFCFSHCLYILLTPVS